MMMWGRRRRPWREQTYLALDLETTGLRPATDEIVSLGAVPIRDGIIRWGDRMYTIVRGGGSGTVSPGALGIHQILPGEAEAGSDLDMVIRQLRDELEVAIVVVHHAAIDIRFLRRAFRDCGQRWPRPQVIDTVRLLGMLERRLAHLEPYPAPVPRGLAEARRRLGLPVHRSHHALADALATAELFLALRARLNARRVGQVL